MDCLIKHSFSFVLEGVIKKLVEDVNSYSYLLTTEDWGLLVSLNEAVVDRGICENQCLGCLEFARTIRMFLNFSKGIHAANKKYLSVVIELLSIFKITNKFDEVALALDFVISPDYVKSKISAESAAAYDKYVDAVKGEVCRLAFDHLSHEQAKCLDTISSYGKLEVEQIIRYEIIDRHDGMELFYVDQNVISKYVNDENFRKQIENFKGKVGCQFVYSPYVIEDAIKMSRVRLTEYFGAIEKMTDSAMLIRSDGGVLLAKEDIQVTVDRVLLWRTATRASEDLKIHKMHLNKWMYPHYSKNSRLSKCANKDIGRFLNSLRPHVDNMGCDLELNDDESDWALCRRLYAYTIEKSFSLRELVDGTIKHEGDAECMRRIEDLCDFLDLINYQTESPANLNKIRSSLQDAEHLRCAWKADYFVTDDKRLRARGEFIYSTLGLSTKFISIDDLKGKIISEFKSPMSGGADPADKEVSHGEEDHDL